jgi:hypothetical protein
MTTTRRGPAILLILWIGLTWGCAAAPPCPPPDSVQLPAAQPLSSSGSSTAALQQRVKTQEKRISELSLQLNLLKRIDQDQQRQR